LAAADPVKVVASENFYGDLAQQIGGANVEVTSILTNPDQDPHLFEASASMARDVAAAKVVIVNGADYDPWMEKLLSANKAPGRKEIVVAKLVRKKVGDNPHLWYDPATMLAFAKVFAAELSSLDPAHKAEYANGASRLADALKPLEAKIGEMKEKYAGQPVTASEPVFGYMAQALGLKMRNERFQLAVMNDTEPSASDIAAFENDLKNHKVKVMLYNSQASDPAVQRLVGIARQSNVPVVGVSETEPAGKTYQEWMLDQLNALDRALAGRSS
jgi:zinc/manganese transport system substrate-binding protein